MRTPAHCLYIACLILLLATNAEGATRQVSSNLQAAIDAAAPGDTLLVAPGHYDRVTVAKSLNLVGDGAVIAASSRDACIKVEANNVNISGFTVREGFYGILLQNVQGCNISRNTVLYCAQPGIALLFSDKNVVAYNNASFNGIVGEGWYGIYLSNSNDNLIMGNVASNNGAYGIDLFPSCNNNTIVANVLEGNRYGLYMFSDCANNLIAYNQMSRNINSGIDMRFNCHDNKIVNNTIAWNAVAGITFMGSGNNSVEGNDVVGNSRYGLQIQDESDANVIINNNISGSQTGLFMASSGNLIYGNRIIENVVPVQERGENTWNAAYPVGGNIWGDYTGRDEMGGPGQDTGGPDGIGDQPYEIGGQSADMYPIAAGQVRPIQVAGKSISPQQVTVGGPVSVNVALESKYEISQVAVRAVGSDGVGAGGYVRMVGSGGSYEGSLMTALMEPGKYDLILSAGDARGNSIEESLGQVDIAPRGGWDIDSESSS